MANTKWVKPRNSKNNAVAAPAVPDQELDTDDDILMPDDHEADAAEEQEDEVLGDEGDTEDSYHEPEEADDELTTSSGCRCGKKTTSERAHQTWRGS